MQRRLIVGLAALAAFIGSVVAANYLVETFGPIPVGFGLMAPAGVYVAGAAFLLRDVVQRSLGRVWVVAAILVGAGLAYFISPSLALASAVAFLVSETTDFAVYTPLQARGFTLAVVVSNVVGAVVDSLLFLWLAFGSLAFLQGQVIGKLWITGAFLLAAALMMPSWRKRAIA